jgi:purine-nucleoside phosphorylase
VDRSGSGLLTTSPVGELELDKAAQVAARLQQSSAHRPLLGIVLGSGLAAFAENLESAQSFAFGDLPHFSTPRVAGHPGKFWLGVRGSVPLAVLQGRLHLYEGCSPNQVVFGIRVLRALGVRGVLLTNAAGGIRDDLARGTLMKIADHLNLSGHSPLRGENDGRMGVRFPDLSHVYDSALAQAMDAAAIEAGLPALASGVYAQVLGPAFETPAEVRMLRTLGADAVGMSTVLEAIAARHAGLRVAGLSFIANRAAGLGTRRIDHDAVTAAVQAGVTPFVALLDRFVPKAAALLSG